MQMRFRVILAIVLIETTLWVYDGNFRIFAAEGDEYTIGIEDVLSVSILEQPDLNSTATVGPDGTIVLKPPIGALRVDGFTRAQLEAAVRERLSRYIKGDLNVTVQVTQYNSRKVSIFGDGIRSPGSFSFAKIPSFLEILAKASGLTPNADRARIRILPADGPTQVINLEQLLQETRPSWPTLAPGDTIFIPAKPPVTQESPPALQQPAVETPDTLGAPQKAGEVIIYVLGQVSQQGSFTFETPPSLLSVLTQAIPTQPGLLKQIKVTRANGTSLTVDMTKYIETGDAALLPRLQSGDLVYVPMAGISREQSVALFGAVGLPGSYPIDQPTNLMDVLAKAGGLTANADSKKIQVTRETPDFIQTKIVDLRDASFEVWPGDRVLVPPQSQGVVQTALGALRDVLLIIRVSSVVF
ncbi:MAG: SLBB domain-containing protein [Candidatus Poribacteria bacterium]|nr:SLBB domain-containing protein [Candidatus Poribacteria bacterium]